MTDGFNHRKGDRNNLAESLSNKTGLANECHLGQTETFILNPDCRTHDEPEVLVWGDSYARHLIPGILASNPDVKMIQFTKSSCGPFFNVAPIKKNIPQYAASCHAFTKNVKLWLASNASVKYVVLSSPFEPYLDEHEKLLRNDQIVNAGMDLAIEEFTDTLETIRLMGRIPIVFAPPPKTGAEIGRCLANSVWNSRPLDQCNFKTSDVTPVMQQAYSFLHEIEKKYKVVWLNDIVCDNNICKTHIGSIFIYSDYGHLSRGGSAWMGREHHFYDLITEG